MRRFARASALMGLILVALGVLSQLAMVVLLGKPLLLGTAFFTLILAVPLLLQTVLHPEVIETADGLRLRPLLWREQRIGWAQVCELVPHPLIYEDVVNQRKLYGKDYRPRRGVVVVVEPHAPLSPLYRIVGGLSGAGWRPAFALSTTTHTGYDDLLALIEQHLEQRQDQATGANRLPGAR
jgi:hypothetical protein